MTKANNEVKVSAYGGDGVLTIVFKNLDLVERIKCCWKLLFKYEVTIQAKSNNAYYDNKIVNSSGESHDEK